MKTWAVPVVLVLLAMVGGLVIWVSEGTPGSSAIPNPEYLNEPSYPSGYSYPNGYGNAAPSQGTGTSSVPAITTPTPPTTTPIQPDNGSASVLTAANVDEINTNEGFILSAYPQVSFSIGNIDFGTGGVTNSYCEGLYQSGSTYIFLQDEPPGSSPSGTCIDASQEVDGQPMRAVAFPLTINNNSASDIYGIFVRGTYELPNGASGSVNRIAQDNPPWAGYGATAYSSHTIIIGLEVPAGITQMNLYYGSYPLAGQPTTQANFNDQGGYILNFSSSTIENNPG